MNPYAPPQADTAPPEGPSSEDRSIREAHARAETNIKQAGILAYLLSLAFGALWWSAATHQAPPVFLVLFGLVIVGLLYCGWALRRLRSAGRVLATGLYLIITLTGFLPNTEGGEGLFLSLSCLVPIVGPIVWWLFWSSRPSKVFSERYTMVIIPATPDVRIPGSRLIWLPIIWSLWTGIVMVLQRLGVWRGY